MKLTQIRNNAAAGAVILLLIAITGCATGYRLHRDDGMETLYHVDASGTRRIVYVVNKNGSLQIHTENDPLVKRAYADHQKLAGVMGDAALYTEDEEIQHRKMMATKLIRMGRLQVAQKRRSADPIFVTVRKAEADPTLDAEEAQQKYRKLVMDELRREKVFTITPKLGDVDIFFKSYVRKTAAVNVKTQKLVTVSAFYFEALVRSNYHPAESHTICELGHLMDRQEVIKRTAQRVTKVIKEQIGPDIPKDRGKFLLSNSRGV